MPLGGFPARIVQRLRCTLRGICTRGREPQYPRFACKLLAICNVSVAVAPALPPRLRAKRKRLAGKHFRRAVFRVADGTRTRDPQIHNLMF